MCKPCEDVITTRQVKKKINYESSKQTRCDYKMGDTF